MIFHKSFLFLNYALLTVQKSNLNIQDTLSLLIDIAKIVQPINIHPSLLQKLQISLKVISTLKI